MRMRVLGHDVDGNELETSLALPGVPRVGDELEVVYGGGLLGRDERTEFVKVELVTWPTLGEVREPAVHVSRPPCCPDGDWCERVFPAIGGDPA